jgi:hypothetical protein
MDMGKYSKMVFGISHQYKATIYQHIAHQFQPYIKPNQIY